MRNILRFLIRLTFNILTRVEVTGWENVPAGSRYVIAANHIGIADGLIFFYALDNWNVFTLVGEKWKEKTFFRFLGRYLDFVFIDRFNPDLKTLREVLKRMQNGQTLIIAPEGTRSRTGALIEGKPGASYLAAKSGFPILPIAITGSEDKNVFGGLKHFKRAHITVTAGAPFILPPLPTHDRDATLQQYTDEIMCRIAALLPERYWGVYADHPRLKELLQIVAPVS
jgi:1-acyl-sn-glycerol-3-phosphate acyltransferase